MQANTAEWITAIATAVAAAATIGAAIGAVAALLYASRAARAAAESASTARAALQAESVPLLLDVPYEDYPDFEHEYPWPGEAVRRTSKRGQIALDPASGAFAVPVRNVGRGAARIVSFSMSLRETRERFAQYGGIAVAPGEDVWLSARPEGDLANKLRGVPSPLHGTVPLEFSVTYTDIADQQEQKLEMWIGALDGDSAWRVLRTAHSRPLEPGGDR